MLFNAVVPNLFGTRDWFCGRQFFHRRWQGTGDGSGCNASDGEPQMKLCSLARHSPPAVRPVPNRLRTRLGTPGLMSIEHNDVNILNTTELYS